MKKEQDNRPFGEILSHTLKNKGIHQQELAKEIGITTNTISCYCNNKRYPTLQIAYKIADYLKMSLDELCDRPNYRSDKYNFENSNLQYIADIYDILNEQGKIQLKLMAENIASNKANLITEKIDNLKHIFSLSR